MGLLAGSPYAVSLLRLAAKFPDMVQQALKTLEPNTILTYLFHLTHSLGTSYDHLRVVNAPEGHAVSAARAALYEAIRQVLSNGTTILGLTPVER
jgi:arginyl-tRNA synthetase